MSFINDIRIVGELTEDAKVLKSANGSEYAIIKVKTGRPYKKPSGTEWIFQDHTILCYKTEAFQMIRTHAKSGSWMKFSGELNYDQYGKGQILIRKHGGDIGMMFPVLNQNMAPKSEAPAQPEVPSQSPAPLLVPTTQNTFKDDEPEQLEPPKDLYQSTNNGFAQNSKKWDEDDIPF